MRKVIWLKIDNSSDEDDEDITLEDFPLKQMVNQSSFSGIIDDFNFWIMHSNFTITLTDIENLKKMPGIESLDTISQYRLRIGIGKLFDEEKVRAGIAYILDSTSDSDFLGDDAREKVDDLIKTFEEDKWWAILVLQNGEIVTHVGQDEKNFKAKLEFFQRIKELTSCQLITSQD